MDKISAVLRFFSLVDVFRSGPKIVKFKVLFQLWRYDFVLQFFQKIYYLRKNIIITIILRSNSDIVLRFIVL